MGNKTSSQEEEIGICIDSVGQQHSLQELKRLGGTKPTLDSVIDKSKSTTSKKSSSSNPQQKPQKSSHSVSSARPGCLGCIGEQRDWLDSEELMMNFEANKPRGRLTADSIAFLDNSEVNLFKSSASRNVSAVRFFLSRGANINILDEERTSPLHVASRHGSLQVVQELLHSGADCDITDIAGWTPLHVAAFFKRFQICQVLLENEQKDKKYPKEEQQQYCLQEQDNEYFMDPNEKNNQEDFPDRLIPLAYNNNTINNNKSTGNKNKNNLKEPFQNEQNRLVLTQYEIMAHNLQVKQQNQSTNIQTNQQSNLADFPRKPSSFDNKKQEQQSRLMEMYQQQQQKQHLLQDNLNEKPLDFSDELHSNQELLLSMENYREEEIEEQKTHPFIIKDSVCMNSPKFSLQSQQQDNKLFIAKKNILSDTPDQISKDKNIIKNSGSSIHTSLTKKSTKNEQAIHENSPSNRTKNLIEICENVNAEDEEINEPRQRGISAYSAYFTAMKNRISQERHYSTLQIPDLIYSRSNSFSKQQAYNSSFYNSDQINSDIKEFNHKPNDSIDPSNTLQYLAINNNNCANNNQNNKSSASRAQLLSTHKPVRLRFNEDDEGEEANVALDDAEVCSEDVMKIQDSIRLHRSPPERQRFIGWQQTKQSAYSKDPNVESIELQESYKNTYKSDINLQKQFPPQTASQNVPSVSFPHVLIEGNTNNNIYLQDEVSPVSLRASNISGFNTLIGQQQQQTASANKKKWMAMSPTPSMNSIMLLNRDTINIEELCGRNYNSISNNYNSSQSSQFERSQNAQELGISLLNAAPLSGLSFLLLFKFIQPSSSGIAGFLLDRQDEKNYLLKKSKSAITEILSEISLAEHPAIIQQYTQSYNFSGMEFTAALRVFLQDLQVPNEPETIDRLLSSFAKNFYKEKSIKDYANQVTQNGFQKNKIEKNKMTEENNRDNNSANQKGQHLLFKLSYNQNGSQTDKWDEVNNQTNQKVLPPKETSKALNQQQINKSSSPVMIKDIIDATESQKQDGIPNIPVSKDTVASFQKNITKQQQYVFESSDTVHMLAFAVVMLDIDLHFHKIQKMEDLVAEFKRSVAGINEGQDFSPEFLEAIVKDVISCKLSSVVSSQLLVRQKQHYIAVFNLLLYEKAQFFVPVFNKRQEELILFILGDIAVISNKTYSSQQSDTGNNLNSKFLSHLKVFSLKSLIITYSNQTIMLTPANIFGKQQIQVAKLSQTTWVFELKEKLQIKLKIKSQDQGDILEAKLKALGRNNNHNNSSSSITNQNQEEKLQNPTRSKSKNADNQNSNNRIIPDRQSKQNNF